MVTNYQPDVTNLVYPLVTNYMGLGQTVQIQRDKGKGKTWPQFWWKQYTEKNFKN